MSKYVTVTRVKKTEFGFQSFQEEVGHVPPVRLANHGPDAFLYGCTQAGILPTLRQLKKFKRGKGLSYDNSR